MVREFDYEVQWIAGDSTGLPTSSCFVCRCGDYSFDSAKGGRRLPTNARNGIIHFSHTIGQRNGPLVVYENFTLVILVPQYT